MWPSKRTDLSRVNTLKAISLNKIGSLLVLLAVGIVSAGILVSIEYVYYKKRTVSWKKQTELEKNRRNSRKSQVDEMESKNG